MLLVAILLSLRCNSVDKLVSEPQHPGANTIHGSKTTKRENVVERKGDHELERDNSGMKKSVDKLAEDVKDSRRKEESGAYDALMLKMNGKNC